MEPSREEKSANFLLDASLLYKDKCPELSRFFLQWRPKANGPQNHKLSSLLQNTLVCPHCCQWLQPDNHHIRLWPKPSPSARVQSVLLRKARGKRLSLVQKGLLQRFQKSSSVLGNAPLEKMTGNRRQPCLAGCFGCLLSGNKKSSTRGYYTFLRQSSK